MKLGSLFSGLGGFDIAAERAENEKPGRLKRGMEVISRPSKRQQLLTSRIDI